MKGKKLFGCCIHPEFGGFFSMRAAVFTGTPAPDNMQQKSLQLNLTAAQITGILAEFNSNWQAGEWRRISFGFKYAFHWPKNLIGQELHPKIITLKTDSK